MAAIKTDGTFMDSGYLGSLGQNDLHWRVWSNYSSPSSSRN